ncbi:peptidoglycan-binding protein [Azospirillum brasilense]|uniref:Peptidoglycan-binding domain-containing protein n=1 Tax=Azospirillum brasilense TaxID=192 RepID=A0A0P0EG57_AZOBR|nr:MULTISPECIES: peptidoglycan-binding domain-containing protein [Azospirillum]ALJ36878.1 hypothetical protein AMK58_15270 [Azospirillum brasilense]MDW7555814.1 peptidoglycan-binding domain-containing protein [Azospirillum brasilense]MDW7595891.1 peptidoglycan-binding domain-containing protein [Azospirillum brasilense]MDW7630896.1 peptidoglycan-binding domain-containing protein [Azospirillum brasilense]MDX5951502.1 peptidoglycan-binding domain-containing protein [Azospirillum brasilense]
MPVLYEAHIAYGPNGRVTVPGLAERRWNPGDGVLGIGGDGLDVAAVQRALQRRGFSSIVEGGDFSRQTASAVEQVQAVHRLPVTGRVGTPTAIALRVAFQQAGSSTSDSAQRYGT